MTQSARMLGIVLISVSFLVFAFSVYLVVAAILAAYRILG